MKNECWELNLNLKNRTGWQLTNVPINITDISATWKIRNIKENFICIRNKVLKIMKSFFSIWGKWARVFFSIAYLFMVFQRKSRNVWLSSKWLKRVVEKIFCEMDSHSYFFPFCPFFSLCECVSMYIFLKEMGIYIYVHR